MAGPQMFYIRNPDGSLTQHFGAPPAGYVPVPSVPVQPNFQAAGPRPSVAVQPQRPSFVSMPPTVRTQTLLASQKAIPMAPLSIRRAPAKKTKVAILGGALDPPTLNHLLGASEVIHSGMADEVWLMPCGPRPDKPNLSPAIDRFMMTELAVNTFFSSEMPIHASSLEVFNDDGSWRQQSLATYDSLSALRSKYPDKEFSFVIGTDWLQPGTDLREWTSIDPVTGEEIVTGDKLVSEFDFLIMQRPGYDVEDVTAFGPRMIRLEMPDGMHFMEGSISSTEVRKRADISARVREDLQLVEGLVAPAVLSYIYTKELYHKRQEVPRPLLARSQSSPGVKNVAVFGGAFDPPTNSHVLALAEIVHSGIADEALLVPCGPRPDKPNLRPALTRYIMCELACNSAFSYAMPVRASSIEVFEEEAMATYDTLCALKAQAEQAGQPTNFMFVIGSDWLQPGTDLRTWTSKDPVTGEQIVTGDKLVSEFDFIVVRRPGSDVQDLSEFGPRMRWMEMNHGMKNIDSNLSSTEVRKRAARAYARNDKNLRLVDGLVPTAVRKYIERESVYKPDHPSKKL